MTFFTILCALLFDQFKPLCPNNRLLGWFGRMAWRVESWCNAGHYWHGRMAWFLVMAAFLVPTLLIAWLLGSLHPLFELAWNILVVYLTVGFQRNSQYFREVQIALVSGEEWVAQNKLTEWVGVDASGMDAQEMTRLTMEKALLASHRQVFGLVFWLFLLPSPLGAVLYRVSEYLARVWNEPSHMHDEVFGQFARHAFYWIEWLPARVTAASFAIVGNFEDAIYAWRRFAHRWNDEATGIILAAGGGALGIRLGTPEAGAASVTSVGQGSGGDDEPESETMPGEVPMPGALQSMFSLVRRALLLWMVVLLLLSMAF